jgi:hypothetical protein
MMKLISIIFLFYFISPAFSQTKRDSANYNKLFSVRKVRNFVGIVPSKADQINGWTIGLLLLDENNNKCDSMIINGLYTNISPAQVAGVMLIPYMIGAPFELEEKEIKMNHLDTNRNIIENKINGLSIGIVEITDWYVVNGIQISGLSHSMYKLNGLSVSLGESFYSSFKGVMISGLLNQTLKGKGLQIGLVNSSKTLRGVQIGLWNRIGKRSLPIINMSFKKKNMIKAL